MTDEPAHPLGGICSADMAMELKCVCLKPYLRYLEDNFGAEKMHQIIADTRMSVEYLAGPDNWVSYDYVCRLLQKLVDTSGDARAPFEAACRYTDRASYGPLGLFLLHLGSPGTMYKLIVRFHDLWNRIGKCRMLSSRSSRCTIEVSYATHRQNRNNCLALQGSLAAIPRQFGLRNAEITHSQCACHGAQSCIYEITWKNRQEPLHSLVAFLFGAVAGAAIRIVGGSYVSDIAMFALIFALLSYLLVRCIDYRIALDSAFRQNDNQAASLLEAIRAAEKLNEELQEKVERRTEDLKKANIDLEKALDDLRKSQAKALLAERHAAVGVLAAGMAHEMNNPISAIKLSIQAAKEVLGNEDHRLDRAMATIERACNRSRRLVDELLSFSREPRQTTDARLEDILDSSLAIFMKDCPTGIKIARCVTPNVPPLALDKMQIQQALINLLSNASDAMRGSGDIEVVMEANGREVILSVKDHGTGMSLETQSRLFQPFFTTKTRAVTPHAGTGLGLAISSQLVKRNGGTIDVVSREGDGSTFTMRFPVDISDTAAAHDPG